MSTPAPDRIHRPLGFIAATLAIVGAVSAAGCRSAPIDVGEDLGFMQEAAPGKVLSGHDAMPAKASRFTYAITEGRGAGSDVIIIQERDENDEIVWIVSRAPANDPDKPTRRDRIRYEDDGSIVLLETHNIDRDVISRFDPPLIILPSELKPDDPHEQKLTMTLHPPSTPDRERDRGDARNTITLVASQRLETGDGGFDALRIEAVLEADLRAAKVLNKTDTWIVPETGMVAERYNEEARAFGIVVSSRTHLMVVKEIENE
ncbi:MAG: hypothetical protein EA376_12640 [Phycisphaeraceae bacterium]|nr:MAG: hypothetical protein EA376_12640 [Phycisphaeraceae bacterium]